MMMTMIQHRAATSRNFSTGRAISNSAGQGALAGKPEVKPYFRRVLLSGCVCLGLATSGSQAFAQTSAPSDQPKAETMESLARLSAQNGRLSYLKRLAVDPRDVAALIGAGETSLDLRDARAAFGFFKRADDISPVEGRIKAGLGRALLGLQKVDEALAAMERASSYGYVDRHFLIDRGLARDLTGDQVGAQRDYASALRLLPNDDETLRRYAVSLGISGEVDQADKLITPLLYKSDRPAWRDRAFIMAMNGRHAQADAIIQRVMPPDLAIAIQPYMNRMHMLNRVQRAEAVYMGKFPAGLVQAAIAPVQQVASAEGNTGRSKKKKDKAKQDEGFNLALAPAPVAPPARVAAAPVAPSTPPVKMAVAPSSPPVVQPYRAQVPTSPPVPTAPVSVKPALPEPQTPALAPVVASAALAPALVQPAAPAPAPATIPALTVAPSSGVVEVPPPIRVETPVPQPPAPSTVSSPVTDTRPAVASVAESAPLPVQAASPVAAPVSGRVSVPAPASSDTRSLADIMATVEVPATEQQASVAPVDLAEVAALQAERRKAKLAAEAKAKKDAEAKLKKEADLKAKAEADAEKKRLAANPARIWVQVATGRDIKGLGFDLRRLRKKYPDEMGSKGAGTAAWGNTNRLVVGPFASAAKGKDFASALRKAGADVMVWNSDAGQEVKPIGGK
jgi:Flp pilus assembly protein TadD